MIRSEQPSPAPAGNKNSSLQVQSIRFLITGVLSAMVDLGLTYLIHEVGGQDHNLSRLVGFICGTTTAYMINRRWTFQSSPSGKRFSAVVVLYTLTAAINLGFFSIGYDLFINWGLNSQRSTVLAFVIAQGTATVINFIVQRFWIFRDSAGSAA